MTIKKLDLGSKDMIEFNINELEKILPEVITEEMDETGRIKKSIDFDKFKACFSKDIVKDGKERYEFTWPGKKKAMAEVNKLVNKTLRPVVEDSKGWDETQNLYIEGDNLEVLKLLQESYLGKVKMIYIDPPYNTGNDFVYNDDFKESPEDYKDEIVDYGEDGSKLFKNTEFSGRFHSKWCTMIYPRLRLARNLLSEDGVIFISIDYNEQAGLKLICDEIFGHENFVGEIYWESKTKSQNTKTSYNKLQPKVEKILTYKKKDKDRFNLIEIGKKTYPFTDEQGEYREYILEEMDSGGIRGRKSMVFDISDGHTTVSPGEGKQWKLGKNQIDDYLKTKNLFIKNGKVIIKMRPDFERTNKTEPFWGFINKTIGTTESAKINLNKLMGCKVFDTVKPVNLIKKLVYHSSYKNDLILDFFSGSATTAHAVMELNAEDGGNRKFIMVNLPEETDENSEAYKAGYKNICEIGKERIRRAGDKILVDNKDKEGIENLDTGFRVLRVDSTNMKDVYYTAESLEQNFLNELESNIKEDRTELDLLFSCLLAWGLPLDKKYKSEDIGSYTIHSYNDGDLVACFSDRLSKDIIKHIAEKKPERVVFRDSCFKSSEDKINVEEIFKAFSPETDIRVL